MLFVGYQPELLAALVLLPAIMWPAWAGLKRLTKTVPPSVRWSALPLAFLALVVCTAAARSTLDHRPFAPPWATAP